jgi:hypothetical protein
MGDISMCLEEPPWVSLLERAALILIIVLVAACADIHKSADYERHRYSQLVVPYDRNDVMYFDVTFNAEFPDGEATEATRMEWLKAWLGQRSMCAESFEIVDRRPFEPMENNPAHHDIRYEVKCGAE